jgi:hypothetical protein
MLPRGLGGPPNTSYIATRRPVTDAPERWLPAPEGATESGLQAHFASNSTATDEALRAVLVNNPGEQTCLHLEEGFH